MLIVSCGQQGNGRTATTIHLISGALSGSGGALMVYGVEHTSNRYVAINANDGEPVLFDNGQWTFHVLQYDGPSRLSGDLRCGKVSAELSGADIELPITVSMDECGTAIFTDPTYFDSGTLTAHEINLDSCLSTVSIAAAADNCSAYQGESLSFRLMLLDTLPSTLSAPIIGGNPVVSETCHDFSTSNVVTGERLLLGSPSLPIPVGIQFFSGTGCSGTQKIVKFPHGLHASASVESKHFSDGTNKRTNLYVKDGSAAPLTALVSSVNVPAMFDFELKRLVTGGIEPFTYSITGIGDIFTGGIYHNSGSGSSVVDITDVAGETVSITVEAGMSNIYYDFNGFLPSDWFFFNSSTAYTFVGSGGLVSEMSGGSGPRFHSVWDGATYSSTGILLEPARQNLVPNSLNIAAWTTTNVAAPTIQGSEINPYGTTGDVYLVDDQITSSQAFINYNQSSITAGEKTFSIYMKQGTSSIALLYFSKPATGCTSVLVDLANGVVQPGPFCGTAVERVALTKLANNWYRVSVSYNMPASGNVNIRVWPAINSVFVNSEDKTATGSILLYGAQLEEGNSMTSFIKTTGTSQSRAMDNLYVDFISSDVVEQGAFLYKFYVHNELSNKGVVISDLLDGANGIRVAIDSIGKLQASIKVSGSSVGTVTTALPVVRGENVLAISYDSTKLSLSLNGADAISTALSTPPVALTTSPTWNLGNDSATSSPMDGSISKVEYYTLPISPIMLKILTE